MLLSAYCRCHANTVSNSVSVHLLCPHNKTPGSLISGIIYYSVVYMLSVRMRCVCVSEEIIASRGRHSVKRIQYASP